MNVGDTWQREVVSYIQRSESASCDECTLYHLGVLKFRWDCIYSKLKVISILKICTDMYRCTVVTTVVDNTNVFVCVPVRIPDIQHNLYKLKNSRVHMFPHVRMYVPRDHVIIHIVKY